MVHGNKHDIYFMIQRLDRRYHQLKIKSKNIKAIFPASGGRTEMIVLGVYQSRGFLLILYRERQILKLIKFCLSLLKQELMGNRLVRFDDQLIYKL